MNSSSPLPFITIFSDKYPFDGESILRPFFESTQRHNRQEGRALLAMDASTIGSFPPATNGIKDIYQVLTNRSEGKIAGGAVNGALMPASTKEVVCQFDDAAAISGSRLARINNDFLASRALPRIQAARGGYQAFYELMQKLVERGKSTSTVFNEMARFSLYLDGGRGPDIEVTVKAVQLAPTGTASMHTLACVYAEAGRTKEAHELMIRAMDPRGFDEPDSDFWFIEGLLAEQYGDGAAAITRYSRVGKPDFPGQIPESTYFLAQSRMKKIRGT